MPEVHAKFSPSSAHRWTRCPASISLEQLVEKRRTSEYAAEGTAAHFVAEQALNQGVAAKTFVGNIVSEWQHPESESYGVCWEPDVPYRDDGSVDVLFDTEVTAEMAEFVQVYIDAVKRADGELLVEQQLDFSEYLGLEDQFGTGDAVVINAPVLEVHDLKYGRGVMVDAEENEQLMLYGLGALAAYGLLEDFETVKLVIHQPRLDHVSEWEVSVEDLEREALRFKKAAEAALSEDPPFAAGEKQCRWCEAKGICKVAAGEVQQRMGADEFSHIAEWDNVTASMTVQGMGVEEFEEAYLAVPFIEIWLKAMHERAIEEAEAGRLKNFKMVAGRRGARTWSDGDQAEATMKSMRLKLDEMYSKKLISPPTAEKLLKNSPRKWGRLKDLITQSEGKPTIAPITDKRPALISTADGFEDLTADNNDTLI